MKKTTLWITAVPAILLTIACGAKSNDQSSATKLMRSNPTETSVNIFCKDCLVSMDGEEKYSSVFIEKISAEGQQLKFNVKTDESKPFALLPANQDDVDFQVDGTKSKNFDYKMHDDTRTTADLSFTLPSDEPYGKVDIIIDATTECMDFVVSVTKENLPVEFKFNGSLNHVDWGDGSTTQEETDHTFKETGDYTVKVHGNVSSVWFTKKGPLTSNNVPLAAGNTSISKVSINHSITTLPSYAFEGCTGLQQTYIGNSVTSIGEKAFVLNDLIKDPIATHNVISCSKTSAPTGWDKNWTDCPISYGVPLSEANDNHTDKQTNLQFKVINIDGASEPRALITGSQEVGGPASLTIPATVSDGDKIKDCPVYGIAPFAFYNKAGVNIRTISIAPPNFAEIGDFAFAYTNPNQINLTSIKTPDLPFLRFGRRAFWYVKGANLDLDFIALTGEHVLNPELIIDEECFRESNIHSIVLPDTSFKLKTISKGAFKNSNINKIIGSNKALPSSITTIEENAFEGCSSFYGTKPLDIPETVQIIKKNAFINCNFNVIRTVYEEDKKPAGWEEGWNYKKSVEEPDVPETYPVLWGFLKEITAEDGLLYNVITSKGKSQAILVGYDSTIAGELSTLNIPDVISDPETNDTYDVVSIADRAFADCYSLAEINFSSNNKVTKIGQFAFENCEQLSSVVIPATVKEVGEGAFQNWTEFCELVIFYEGSEQDVAAGWHPKWNGDGNNMGAALYTDFTAEYDPHSLDNQNFRIACKKSGNDVAISKYVSGSTSVAIPETITNKSSGVAYNVTEIGAKSFMRSTLSDGIDFSNAKKLTTIGLAAFAGATLSATEADPLSLPNTVTKIDKFAFYQLKGVEKVNLSNTQITEIPYRAFASSKTLKSVTVPTTVNKLGKEAFLQLKNLTTLDLSGTAVTEIPDGLFNGCQDYDGISALPTGITTIGKESFVSTNIGSSTEGKVDLSKTALKNVGEAAFAGCQSLVEIKFPSLNVTDGLAPNLFAESSALTTIDLSQVDGVATSIIGTSIFGKQLPSAFTPGNSGKIITKDKATCAQYCQTEYWQKIFGDDITNHFTYPGE